MLPASFSSLFLAPCPPLSNLVFIINVVIALVRLVLDNSHPGVKYCHSGVNYCQSEVKHCHSGSIIVSQKSNIVTQGGLTLSLGGQPLSVTGQTLSLRGSTIVTQASITFTRDQPMSFRGHFHPGSTSHLRLNYCQSGVKQGSGTKTLS